MSPYVSNALPETPFTCAPARLFYRTVCPVQLSVPPACHPAPHLHMYVYACGCTALNRPEQGRVRRASSCISDSSSLLAPMPRLILLDGASWRFPRPLLSSIRPSIPQMSLPRSLCYVVTCCLHPSESAGTLTQTLLPHLGSSVCSGCLLA